MHDFCFRWLAVWILGFSLSLSDGAEGPRVTLMGTVFDFGAAPLKGARVYIHTAKPKDALSVNGSSSYPDCAKRAITDAEGKFKIEGLDPNLSFRLLIAAKEHAPKFEEDVEPESDSIEIFLQPSRGEEEVKQRMRARVLDDAGRPVSGAFVKIRGVTRGESTRFGGNRDLDQEAVSDEEGLFEIRGDSEFTAVGVEVEARGLAQGIFTSLAAGEKIHELKLNTGAAVKGRLVKDGKPVPNVEVGISGVDRSADTYVGTFKAITDNEGRFQFPNLPPQTQYKVYGMMKSLGSNGMLPTQQVRTEEIGSSTDLGDLALAPSYVLEGLVRMKDGTVPPPIRLSLRREETDDNVRAEIDEEGRFSFAGIPAERISLSARLSGHRLSTKNASLDPWNPYHLVGRIEGNKTNLVIEIEPGPNHERMDGDFSAMREEPLRGAEGGGKRGEIKITGTVLDAETGEPLPNFFTTEGRSADFPPEQISWMTTRKEEQTNGTFTVFFHKQPRAPAVMVEAENYLPYSTGPIASLETNLVIRLKKGRGIEGVVLKPDGTPASATKVYLTDMRDGVYVQGPPFQVRDQVYRGTKSVDTDEHGKFMFPASVDAYAVIVVDESGYGEVKVEELAKTREVRLKPYSVVKGKLMIGSKPGPNESIRLGLAHLPYANHPRHFPPLQMYLTTKTDESGNYEFERVAPVAVEVYHEPKVKDGKMGTIATSQAVKLELEPGRTHEVNLGGKGRPVIGKMVVNGYEGEIKWRADVHSIETVVPQPKELPDHATFFSDLQKKMQAAVTDEEKQRLSEEMQRRNEEFTRKHRDFYQTAEGKKYHFQRSRYALNFKEDGSFRIEDVPGGKYSMRIDLREGSDVMRMQSQPIAFLQKEFEVPESVGGRSDEPFDLGTIELKSRRVLRQGRKAPDFSVKTLEGKTVSLNDYKGKFLLLDFWAVWCGPCIEQTPFLKETYEAFKGDERFALLGLSLDPKEDAPREYAKKNDLHWTQGFLGDWSKTQIPAEFGVEGIPAIFLIGPDGKVVASNLRGAGIKSAVSAALGE